MNVNNLISEYYPLYLEALVSIIIFYTLYLLYIKYIHAGLGEYIIKKQFNKQIISYNIPSLVQGRFGQDNANNTRLYLSLINYQTSDNYNTNLQKIDDKNQKALNKLVIMAVVIIGVLLIIAFAIPLLGLYDWRQIEFKKLLFALVLHCVFIVSLEAYLLLVIIPSNSILDLSNLFVVEQNN